MHVADSTLPHDASSILLSVGDMKLLAVMKPMQRTKQSMRVMRL